MKAMRTSNRELPFWTPIVWARIGHSLETVECVSYLALSLGDRDQPRKCISPVASYFRKVSADSICKFSVACKIGSEPSAKLTGE